MNQAKKYHRSNEQTASITGMQSNTSMLMMPPNHPFTMMMPPMMMAPVAAPPVMMPSVMTPPVMTPPGMMAFQPVMMPVPPMMMPIPPIMFPVMGSMQKQG